MLYLSMETINLLRLKNLDNLFGQEKQQQLEAMINLIQTATPEALTGYQMHLVFYKGEYKEELEQMICLRKAGLPLNQYNKRKIGRQEKNSQKQFINQNKTNIIENVSSFWGLFRFWRSSQKQESQPKIKEKNCSITQHKDNKNYIRPTKKKLNNQQHNQQSSLDNLFQEQQQSLVCRPLDSDLVNHPSVFNQKIKYKKTQINKNFVGEKMKQC